MKKKIVISLISVIICCNLGLYSFASTVSDLKDKQEQAEEKRKNAQNDLKDVKNQKTDALNKVEQINDQIVDTQEQISNLNAQIKELEASITQSEKEIEEAQIKYDEQQAALEKRIVAQYKTGKTTYLDVLLNSSSLTNFISNYFLVGKITKADNQLLESISEEKQKIEDKKKELETSQQEIKNAKAQLQTQNSKLKSAKTEKDKQIANLSASEKEIQKKIDEFYKQESDLEAQIKKAESSNNNNSNDGKYTGGQFLWPCPSSKRITSYFGSREQPVAGASTYHKGIDIGAPYGSDILAAAEGTVVTSTYSVSAGNYIMLSHGGGLYTVYMHSSKLLVSVGQKVKKGQVIAKVGSTGYSTGNHLHFGVRKNGVYVNPLGYVQ